MYRSLLDYNGPMNTNDCNTSPAETPAATRKRLRSQAKAARAALTGEQRRAKSRCICTQLAHELNGLATKDDTRTLTVAVYSAFPEEVDLAAFVEHAYQQGCRVAFPCMMSNAWGIPDAPGRGMREPGSDPAAPHVTQQTMEMRIIPVEAFREGTVPFLNNPLKAFQHESAELETMPYVPANELDLIVVPAVGFDAQGNRLGYGAGNYDRYLSQVPDACHVVGAAFAEQQVAPIPSEAHDIPLQFISA